MAIGATDGRDQRTLLLETTTGTLRQRHAPLLRRSSQSGNQYRLHERPRRTFRPPSLGPKPVPKDTKRTSTSNRNPVDPLFLSAAAMLQWPRLLNCSCSKCACGASSTLPPPSQRNCFWNSRTFRKRQPPIDANIKPCQWNPFQLRNLSRPFSRKRPLALGNGVFQSRVSLSRVHLRDPAWSVRSALFRLFH